MVRISRVLSFFDRAHFVRGPLLVVTCFLAGCAVTKNCPANGDGVQVARVDIVHETERTTTVSLWAPQVPGAYPLLVFSHGAFSAPARYTQALSSLAAQGFVVAAPLHIDSELIATTPPPPQQMVWATRVADLRRLADVGEDLQNALSGVRIAPPVDGYLVAGHSLGAFVAQVVAGAKVMGDATPPGADPRVRGVVAFSPPGPMPPFIQKDAWDAMTVPQLVITGTSDVLPGFINDWTAHTQAHRHAQPGDQWLWVGAGVDHYFGRLIGRLTRDVPPQDTAFASALDVAGRFARQYGAPGKCVRTLAPDSDDVAQLTRR